ncbi:MAG: AAA family ATPase [Vicinamibacterales bacterium]
MPLTRKASLLLASLVAAHGRWVSKTELLAAVWPDTHVHPDNVKVLVREIRLALHDDAGSPRYVRNEIGRGYAFVAETSDRPGERAAVSALPLFVNRTSELAALMEALDGVRAGSSRVVLLAGDRGIGKTALCDRFLRATRATINLRAVLGDCVQPPYAIEPLLPIVDALRACCRDAPALLPGLAERAPAWFARLHSAPGADVARLRLELPSVLAALARDVPLVVVLEDLHRADPATIDAVAQLALAPHPARWLVVATACPYSAAPGAAALAALTTMMRDARTSLVLDLAPLGSGQVERYLDARFGPGAFTALAPVLHDLSGGNPASLVAAADRLAAGHGAHDRTLQEIAAAELDRLMDEERAILEAAASSAGSDFAPATVAIAAGLDERDTARCLDRLAHRTRVIGRAAPGAYRFLHPTYRQLLVERAPITQPIRSARRLADADTSAHPLATTSRRHDG